MRSKVRTRQGGADQATAALCQSSSTAASAAFRLAAARSRRSAICGFDVGEGQLGGDEARLEAGQRHPVRQPRLGVVPALARRALAVAAPARLQDDHLGAAELALAGRRVDREAGRDQVVDPGLHRARRAEVVERQAEQDRVGGVDLADQLGRERPGGGLRLVVLVDGDEAGLGARRAQVRDRVDGEIAVGHGAARMGGVPTSRGARGQRPADRTVPLDARVDVKKMGHARSFANRLPITNGLRSMPCASGAL